jgi:hypothetical protein
MANSTPYSLLADLEQVRHKGKPPIHLWNPENVSDIDMTIEADGSWMYLGTPITRQRLSHLFSTVLRREEDDEFYLVTPVEKCRIRVVDAPFVAIGLEESGAGLAQSLRFTTNMADEVTADLEHPIRISHNPDTDEPAPYIMIRDGLEAKITRNVYYQLANLVVEQDDVLGVWSSGTFFQLS